MDNIIDPNIKVNMSLDEIIRLTKPGRANRTCLRRRGVRNRKPNYNFKNDIQYSNHSLPLPIENGCIYVTKNSPLLKAKLQKEIVRGISNRILNYELLKKNKKIIPAKYELIKTNCGVERILVPDESLMLQQTNENNELSSFSSTTFPTSFEVEKPHQLKPLPNGYFSSMGSFLNGPEKIKMEVDEPNDDIVVLESKVGENQFSRPNLVIDLESNDVVSNFVKNTPKKTLHERFSNLVTNNST